MLICFDIFFPSVWKHQLLSQAGCWARWTSLDSSSLPSAFGMGPHADGLAKGNPEHSGISLPSICTQLWFHFLLSCPLPCLVSSFFVCSVLFGASSPSPSSEYPAVWAWCDGARWPLLRSLHGTVAGVSAGGAKLMELSLNPALRFPKWKAASC